MKRLIATFEKHQPAELLRDRFVRAGIVATVSNDAFLQRFVFWTRPAATRKVFVDSEDFERSRGLLLEWERTDHVLVEATRCPECHSPRIEYPQFTRKFITPLIIEWLISLGFAEKDYYCRDCHYTWPRQVKSEPELDVLGFPKRKPKATTDKAT